MIYKLISTRLRDHEDAQGIVRRQGSNLDDEYVFDWLHQFEHALDDSTLATEYNRLRKLSQVFFPIVLMIGAGPRPAPVLDAPRSVERFWENAGVADV